MATTFGLTDQGFVSESFQDARTDLEAALRAAFGNSLALGDRSAFGQITAILAERLSTVWAQLENVYSSQDPDQATGQQLDALSKITGTTRPGATLSTVILTFTGTPLTVVPATTAGIAASTLSQFASIADATILVLPVWIATTSYSAGARVQNGARTYVCTTAGVSASSGGGPSTKASAITDGTAVWRYMGDGTGAVDQTANATTSGAVVGTAGDINQIATPVFGLSGVINLSDAAIGRSIATDPELRVLRALELASPGKSTADAIRAALLQISTTTSQVTAVTIFVNNTDTTNSDGVPPHAIEAMVQQSDVGNSADQAIRDALLANVAAGITTHAASGSNGVTGTALDSRGNSHEIDFSRPLPVPIYVTLNVIKDPSTYPVDGDAQCAAAIVAYGVVQATGKDAVASALAAQPFKLAIPGVLDVQALIDIAPTPTLSMTIAISSRQLATYDTSRIIMNSANGTP